MTKALKTIVCAVLALMLSASAVFAGASDAQKVTATDSWLPFIWEGSGDASVSISKDLWNWIEPNLIVFSEFESISADGKTLADDCYAVAESDGNTVITLKEKYLQTFKDGCYNFTADFKRAVVPLRLYVVTKEVGYMDMCFAFSPWEGTGAATATLSPTEYNVILYADLFESLSYKGNEISPENYSISSFCDTATIMLREEYVKALPFGEHYFTADFADVKGVLLKLTITDSDDSGQDNDVLPPHSPNANYYSATLQVDGKDTSFIENEYYRAYADVFGKFFCDKFDSEKPEKKITDEFAAVIKESAEPTYVTVIFAEIPSDTAAAAEALKIEESDIVALCKTYPAAMIRISADNSDGIIENENVKAIYSAFPTAIHREFVNNLVLEEKYKPTSADARKILRYTARLDSAPKDMAEGKKFFFMSDADLDGKLTSSDARTALRIAAKLEEGKVYWKESEGAGAFWQDANYIK